MTIRSSEPYPEPSSKLQSPSKWGAIRDNISGIFRLIAIPAAVTLAMILPDQIVKWGNFTTGLMVLNDSEKTDILRKVFDICGQNDWKACENYDAERWAQESYIYLDMAETSFERRVGGKIRKSVAQLFRTAYVRASLYDTLSGDVKHCMSLMGQQLGATEKASLDYAAFVVRYSEIVGSECQFLYSAFIYPVSSDDRAQPERAVNRRIATVDRLTEALALRADSKIPAIRARLAVIQKGTLSGLANVCTADIPARSAKLNDDVGAIQSTLFGFRDNKTSNLDLEQAEEESARGHIKNALLMLISLLLIVLNAKKLGHAFNELWMIITHHG
jgi:hypothetical protein